MNDALLRASGRLVLTLALAAACHSRSPAAGTAVASSQRTDTVAGHVGTPAARAQVADSASLPPATASSEASFALTPRGYHIVSSRFFVLQSDEPGNQTALLRETVDQDCCVQAERDTRSTITLEGWPAIADASRRPAWTASFDADVGEMWPPFYRAVLGGCCDASSAEMYVSPRTGRVIFVNSDPPGSTSDGLPRVYAHNTGVPRFAAFQDRYIDTPIPEAKADRRIVGILQYGPGAGPPSRFFLSVPSGDGQDYRIAKIRFAVVGQPRGEDAIIEVPSRNGQADAAAFSGFEIVLAFDNPVEDKQSIVSVPVSSDRVQYTHLAAPTGWFLTPLER